MINWPRIRPTRLRKVGPKPGPRGPPSWDTAPRQASAPIPTVTMTRASSVQYVERTERILVNSERRAPPKPARPAGAGRAAGRDCGARCVAVAMSGPLSSGNRLPGLRIWDARPELHAGGGEFHEGLFQRSLGRGKLVQPDSVVESEVTDLLRVQAANHDRVAVGRGDRAAPGRRDHLDQGFGLRRADADRLDGVARDELPHRAVRDELAPADHQEMIGGVLHLRHQAAGHEYRAALRGRRLHQVPDPPDALRVQAVDRLVEHQDGRVAQ